MDDEDNGYGDDGLFDGDEYDDDDNVESQLDQARKRMLASGMQMNRAAAQQIPSFAAQSP